MAHVVAEPCFGCKVAHCVAVCPVDSFHEGDRMLYIHPDVCIDCQACVPACPTGAIYHEDRLPTEWRPFIDLNLTMANQSARKRRENTRWPAEKQDVEAVNPVVASICRTDWQSVPETPVQTKNSLPVIRSHDS